MVRKMCEIPELCKSTAVLMNYIDEPKPLVLTILPLISDSKINNKDEVKDE